MVCNKIVKIPLLENRPTFDLLSTYRTTTSWMERAMLTCTPTWLRRIAPFMRHSCSPLSFSVQAVGVGAANLPAKRNFLLANLLSQLDSHLITSPVMKIKFVLIAWLVCLVPAFGQQDKANPLRVF